MTSPLPPADLKTRLIPAGPQAIATAAELLASGALVSFPTETVYGLGADAGNPDAVARLYAAKGRPAFNPLIAHVTDLAAAARIGSFDARARAVGARFWPGPLTLVVPFAGGSAVCDLARAGLDTVAIRVPSEPTARALLAAAGRPIVAPSANRSGHVSPTTAAHVMADLSGRIDAVLDGGATTVGVESTILDLTGADPVLLRPGGLAREAIEAALGHPLARPAAFDEARPSAPGRLASHYAPRALLRLDAREVAPGEALLTFAGARPAGAAAAGAILDLSPSGDLTEAAARLYGALRALDASGIASIAVVPLPRTGLGEAIADRLARAAAPRPAPPCSEMPA